MVQCRYLHPHTPQCCRICLWPTQVGYWFIFYKNCKPNNPRVWWFAVLFLRCRSIKKWTTLYSHAPGFASDDWWIHGFHCCKRLHRAEGKNDHGLSTYQMYFTTGNAITSQIGHVYKYTGIMFMADGLMYRFFIVRSFLFKWTFEITKIVNHVAAVFIFYLFAFGCYLHL